MAGKLSHSSFQPERQPGGGGGGGRGGCGGGGGGERWWWGGGRGEGNDVREAANAERCGETEPVGDPETARGEALPAGVFVVVVFVR